MRAVTFADDDTIAFMKKNFVSTWYNQQPRVYPPTSPNAVNAHILCDCLVAHGIAKGAIAARALPKATLPPGTGAGNVKIFFCTPEGETLNYLQGHWTPTEFRQHAQFALALLKIHDAGGPGTRENMVKLHHECEQGHREAARKAQEELRNSPRNQRLIEEINAQNIRANCHELSVQRLLQDPRPFMREDNAVRR